ncbi:MAG: L-serine ammonia-lyase, iron-sulfur-dependent, subunit alpha [Spirochaetota bacterium]
MQAEMDSAAILAILEREMVVALGCTDVAAIAYAAALARDAARAAAEAKATAAAAGGIQKIRLRASPNIIKNAMGVGIPGTRFRGMAQAAALGALAGKADRGLTALEGLRQEEGDAAASLVASGLVHIETFEGGAKLHIEVEVELAGGRGRVVIEEEYDRVVLVEADGIPLQRQGQENDGVGKTPPHALPSLAALVDFVESVDSRQLGIVRKAIELNTAIAEEGLSGDYGLGVGKTLRDNMTRGLLADDLLGQAMAATAAGVDARMAGSDFPVVATTGSGNQGITATLPVLVAGRRTGADPERILRAVALSHLVTISIKGKFGALSGLCGAPVAGTGAACGIVWLLGGSADAVGQAVQNMVGNISGMVCDGAKASCALKASTSAAAAVQAALLAISGKSVSGLEGIVDAEPERSIDNLARLANEGSPAMDALILSIMIGKGEGRSAGRRPGPGAPPEEGPQP